MEALSTACDHCGNEIFQEVMAASGSYCCQGCRIVRENLLASGLAEFYELRNAPLAPVENKNLKDLKYGYLDDPDFLRAKFPFKNGLYTIRFYIEGARCQACLWVLENIPDRLEFVRSSRFSLDKSILEVAVSEDGELSKLPGLIQTYGYIPHLVFEDKKAKELKIAEKKKELRRLGVAFACAGNIMLLSASVYAGLEGRLREWFDMASLLLCAPSVTYCSLPFYRSALGVFRSRNFSIDVSVALGIVFGFLVSAFNVFSGSDVYFDTIAMLVFLLLGSRYLLESARERGMDASEARSFFSNTSAKKLLPDGSFKEIHASLLRPGDVIELAPGDIVPADAKIEAGSSYFNESVLTGESFPSRKSQDEEIFAGSENQSEFVKAVITKEAKNSKMGEILERLQENWGKQTRISRLSDKFAMVLVIAVSLMAAAVYAYFALLGEHQTGLQRALAMVIITCPCALGFNIPISMMIGLRKFARHGIILKEDNVVEKVCNIKKVFLDKTGTVTSGKRGVKLDWLAPAEPEVLLALESRSKHILAKAVREALGEEGAEEIVLRDYLEISGKGPRARIGEDFYEISPCSESNASFGLFKNKKLILKCEAFDEIDPLFPKTVSELNARGKRVYLLSGDNKERVERARNLCRSGLDRAYWKADPASKEAIVSENENSLMFGDGVNDALALKAASVGVAANGGVDLALSSSEVYFCSGGPELLIKLFDGCAKVLSIIKANVALAVAYNIVFVALSVFGHITPLTAAVLMPLSSLTLLAASLIQLKGLERDLSK